MTEHFFLVTDNFLLLLYKFERFSDCYYDLKWTRSPWMIRRLRQR